jgi:tetratricopeptide (TPR) repeat protein
MNWGYPRTWEGFKHAITRGQYEAIKMGDVFSLHFLNELGFYFKDLRTQFTAVLMAVAFASFPLGHLFTKKEHRRTWYSWLAAIGSCFLVMSVLLIALANTKGDVQDGFIQKVKFISSHGMFALWIGYGLVFGAKFAVMLWNKVFGKAAAVKAEPTAKSCSIIPKWFIHLLCFLMLSTSLIPIYENYTNDRLVFELGSAEQNGHTFGWQFGAWQLDGAEEIRDELLADEEPLPNPLWPESMEPNSIFFGGTDPGRFVPTYMIYSANFRPDVYLITQNALADDTYMSVERDLYGDEIWIPSKEDSAESFQIYVEEVQSGKRNANADLKIENGRVQVTGALGVMEINGILTKMMFDHERLRHAFYVEESYVIQWMYPYLSPHGLIMKINKDKNPLTPQIIQNDTDFWDWYVRRLLKDKAFRRDFPAQKSFSKLRAAIAGLYSHTGRYREAEQAFREAVLLYPASPEASFRYIQEVLMPLRKWNTVEDILDYTDRVDPNNSRVRPMRGYMERMRQLTEQIGALQAKAAKSGLSATENIILAGCFLQLGQTSPARGFTKKALESKDANFECFYRGSQIYTQCGLRGDAAQAAKRAISMLPGNTPPHFRKDLSMTLVEGGMMAEANAQLNEYLRIQPNDAEAWLAAAIAKDALSQVTEAQRAIIQAYQCDANLTMDKIRANETLQRIAAPLFRRK